MWGAGQGELELTWRGCDRDLILSQLQQTGGNSSELIGNRMLFFQRTKGVEQNIKTTCFCDGWDELRVRPDHIPRWDMHLTHL
jgi:hypothetical protein